ncbi:pentatricopeptide repeat-containing protein At4g21065-like [Magnolia sinica]|uniref:pentatricopeptide repeat-containing protein At4g21065-like n=1 Tax=Magnolia sinica TaxID=86752 RepID=UPI0026584C96|nr:pentatricopeptide repeat-containing protein At4g21065-like [Magnolia sinica]
MTGNSLLPAIPELRNLSHHSILHTQNMNAIALNHTSHFPNSIKSSENPNIKPPKHQSLNLSLLKHCTHLSDFKQIHAQIIKNPSPQTNILLSKLIESLVNSTHMDYALHVFEEMPEPTTFVYNTMIKGYALSSSSEGIELYIRMRCRGLEPDNFTYPFLLKACRDLTEGKGVHALILKTPGLGADVYCQTSLVTFYSNCRDIEYARMVFDNMSNRNVVSWTAMVTGYMKQKRYMDGLALFHEMQGAEIEPNELTLVNVLTACAHLGALEMGRWVHRFIDRNGVFINPTLGTALIDMYVKCGYIHKASQVFEKLPQWSVCTWNSIIGGLAMHGYGEMALERFEQMQMSETRPDKVTFMGVLLACTHSGLVDKGTQYFYSMQKKYGIEPSIKHYGCFVNLLGRAGLLQEAYKTIKNMPMEPNGVLWGALLNACSSHGNVELAEIAMEHLIELEPLNDGNYVLLSNIYASKGRWDDVAKVRRFMKDRGILKTPGCSSIEVDNAVHEFMAGDSSHPLSKEIYSMLDDVAMKLKAEGYVPKTGHVLHEIDEEEKRQALCHHSEKLAIAFGLVSTSPRTPMRIVKNLRACSDCHIATKLISKIYEREIIVRDRNRFHHFKDGACSCKDYW